MSFSSKTKEELSRLKTDDRCCQIAEVSAILRMAGAIKLRGQQRISMDIVTENAATARLVYTLLKKNMGVQVEIYVKDHKMLKKGHLYVVTVEDARTILESLGIIHFENGYLELEEGLPEKLLKKPCCMRAYIRGAFLGGGSVSDPERGYHLEFVTHSSFFAESFVELLSAYEIQGKITERKGSYIVYLKEGDQIVDLLNVIGAHNALLSFENTRIIKMLRNNVNRIVNCETANMSKTIDAAYKQVMDIEFIRDRVGLSYLSDNLQEIAAVRLENREASLKELGELLSRPVGKSGVNHRLKKIESIAESLRGRLPE